MSDGVILLDKPAGVSSAAVSRRVGRLLAADKAGHGGTLDPAASGLLAVLLGEATAFARYLLGGDKEYEARFVFGMRSDSDDGDGHITPGAPPPADLAAALARALPAFIGDIMQTPPAYSAVKYKGRRLYDYARRGEAAAVQARRVRIDALEVREAGGGEALIGARCGGGVYIRALARDVGNALGCGAYMAALRRARSGGFALADAVSPDALEAMALAERRARLLPIADIVGDLPAAALADDDVLRLGRGVAVSAGGGGGGAHRVYSRGGRFAGVAENREGVLRPLRFLRWTRAAT